MEILYPAGNIEYIKSAIKVGANAVYVGLKLWNARNKVINFGIDEMIYFDDLSVILYK